MLYEILDAPDKRKKRSIFYGIVIHHTDIGGRKEIDEDTWDKLSRNITNYLVKKDSNYVSAHYTVWRNGKVSQLVDPATHEAFHAGKSNWWSPITRVFETDCNKNYIGIEIVGDGNLHSYSDAQYDSLVILTKQLMINHKIHPCCIVGHEMVSPGRKQDPGKLFDWSRLFRGIYK